MKNCVSLCAGVILVFLASAACTPMATYPPVEGSFSLGGAGVEPVPTMMETAIRYAYEQDLKSASAPDELIFNLPAGTPARVYENLISRLGHARPMRNTSDRAYHVKQVRVRGLDGEVDLLLPREGDFYQFVTLTLDKDISSSYQVSRTRTWRIPTDPPHPNYTPRVLANPEQLIEIESLSD